MTNRVIVRFSEIDRYDIFQDADVTMFLATTEKGSYYHEFASEGVSIRDKREKFKAACIEAIQRGQYPGPVELGQ